MSELGQLPLIVPADWGVSVLHKSATVYSGVWGSDPKGDDAEITEDVHVFRVSDVRETNVLRYEAAPVRSVTKMQADRYALNDGDLVIVKSSGSSSRIISGRCAPFDSAGKKRRFIPSNFTFGVRPDHARIQPEFLFYWLRTDWAVGQTKKMAEGSTYPNLKKAEYELLQVALPPLPEQKKIVHILSTVQRAIEAQERIIQTTTELKKALMHKLFTEGLRNEPQKQTEIGPVPESWEVVELGSLAKVGNGSTPKRTNDAYWKGGTVPWLNSTKIHDRFITEADQFVTPVAIKECHLPKVAPNSLLIAITGQGKTLGNSAITRIETCINQHLAYAQFYSESVDSEFVLWFMQTRYEFLRSIAHGGGSTKGALTCGFLKTVGIPVPSLEEQAEIVSVFRTIDQRQAAAANKSASLQDLFRTLLHALMTAKTRIANINFSIT